MSAAPAPQTHAGAQREAGSPRLLHPLAPSRFSPFRRAQGFSCPLRGPRAMRWYLQSRILAPRRLAILLGVQTGWTLKEMGHTHAESVRENSRRPLREGGPVRKAPGRQVCQDE